MPYYHATRLSKLPRIVKEGLHAQAEQNFDCARGVYLSANPQIAFGFLVEDFLLKANEQSRPSEELRDFAVIVIDDSRIDLAQLAPDPNVEGHWREELFIYSGTIDITGMPVLEYEILFPSA